MMMLIIRLLHPAVWSSLMMLMIIPLQFQREGFISEHSFPVSPIPPLFGRAFQIKDQSRFGPVPVRSLTGPVLGPPLGIFSVFGPAGPVRSGPGPMNTPSDYCESSDHAAYTCPYRDFDANYASMEKRQNALTDKVMEIMNVKITEHSHCFNENREQCNESDSSLGSPKPEVSLSDDFEPCYQSRPHLHDDVFA